MKKIIPTILASTLDEFGDKLNKLSSFADEIQIDISDGEFTDNKTIELIDLKDLPSDKKFEAHLMVADPLDYLFHCKRLGIKKIIFHDEVEANTAEVIEKIKNEGFEVFVAINPDTEISQVEQHIANIDGVLAMSVEPGYGGQEFIRSSLEKIKILKTKFPDLVIEVDGGINKNNIKEVFEAGANIAAVGSGILKAENPAEEWKELQKIL